MYNNLRIFCFIISALFAAAAIFVFIYAGTAWGFICVAAAVVLFLLTLFFKRKQEEKENRDNPPPPEGDFITGKVKRDGSDGDKDKDGDSDVENE